MIAKHRNARAGDGADGFLVVLDLLVAPFQPHHRLVVEVGRHVLDRLELEAGRRVARIGIVGNEIAPADFQRVHADLLRGEIDQTFGDRARDGMTDAAILAHHKIRNLIL